MENLAIPWVCSFGQWPWWAQQFRFRLNTPALPGSKAINCECSTIQLVFHPIQSIGRPGPKQQYFNHFHSVSVTSPTKKPIPIDTSNCHTITVISISDLHFSGGEVEVYPNPTSETLTIHTTSLDEDMEYILYNALGQVVLNGTKPQGQSDVHLDLGTHQAGVYFLEIEVHGKVGKYMVVKSDR